MTKSAVIRGGVGVLVFVAVGCSDLQQPVGLGDLSNVSGDMDSVAVVYDPTTKDIISVDVTLRNVSRGSDLKGTTIELRHGAQFTEQAISSTQSRWVISGASMPSLNFIKKGGRYVPTDFDTFRLVTAYHLYERARAAFFSLFDDAFQELGVVCAQCFVKRIVYVDSGPGSDNAYYREDLDAFVMPPQVNYNLVPIGMVPGVVMHEVFHSIFYFLVAKGFFVSGGDVVQTGDNVVYTEADISRHTAESWAVMAIFNEGLADTMAALLLLEWDILRLVVGEQTMQQLRRVDVDQAFPLSTHQKIESGRTTRCDTAGRATCNSLYAYRYLVGSVLARSLVEIGEDLGNDFMRVARILARFLARFNTVHFPVGDANIHQSMTLVNALARLIVQADVDGVKSTFCDRIGENFSVIESEIRTAAGCP